MRGFLNLNPKTLNPKQWELLNLTFMPTCFSPIHSWLCPHHKKACFAGWIQRQNKNPSYEQKIAERRSIQWVGMCFCEHLILLLSALEWSYPQQQWPHTEMFLQNKTCANTCLHLLGVQKWHSELVNIMTVDQPHLAVPGIFGPGCLIITFKPEKGSCKTYQ